MDALAQRTFNSGDSFIVDFGNHYTGYLAFHVGWSGKSSDAPVRLRLTFGEVPGDVAEPLYPYKGWLSASWLPDEIVNVDFLPQQVRVPRRHAFRFVKIDVIATSDNFSATFSDISVGAVSSAGVDRGRPARYDSPLWRDIDKVSIRTLHECMQTSFEDGPRRDRRLWVGDLRLQALTNYVSFGNHDLVRRCLYLFAGLQRDDGYITACVYEQPAPRIGEVVLIDYAVLYGSILLDYYRATKDKQTALELWPIAKRQIDLALKNVNEKGMFTAPEKDFVFIDWQESLDKQAAIQGVMIYSCRQLTALGDVLDLSSETDAYAAGIEKMIRAATRDLFDARQGVFISGKNRQVSWASQAWMALAGVLSQPLAAASLTKVMGMPAAVRPLTPYLYHHMVDALVASGARAEARRLVEDYWGRMVNAGADTFWEAFDPQNPSASPYGSKQINSYCHAWSCTPSYFIRTGFAKTKGDK
ncbi:glycoside hydrolase [Enterobacteriales bacterium SAP-6]|uniref:Glycoside hydrolase n=2 Tax=Acerihabitans arboris TaxID=2691583 RepID=A0A845SFP2_9GAMM|nr:glycoside hydrolase [Acerihabitans arboris]